LRRIGHDVPCGRPSLNWWQDIGLQHVRALA
jgi:hypothetical protein